MRVFFAIVLAAQGSGENSAMATNQAKAEVAKRSVFAMIDRESAIDPSSEGGQEITSIDGDIEFDNVTFAYVHICTA